MVQVWPLPPCLSSSGVERGRREWEGVQSHYRSDGGTRLVGSGEWLMTVNEDKGRGEKMRSDGINR